MNKRVIIFLTLCVVLLIIIFTVSPSLSIWVRNFGVERTSYDFVYSYDWGRNTNGISPYIIENGKLTITSSSTPDLRIFRVRPEKENFTSLAEVRLLKLSSELVSPDGYKFVSEYKSCGSNAQCPHVYLRNINSNKQREIILPPLEFIGGPHFVGWIIP